MSEPLAQIALFVLVVAVAIVVMYSILGRRNIHDLNISKIVNEIGEIWYVSSRAIPNTGTSWLPEYEEVLISDSGLEIVYREQKVNDTNVEYLHIRGYDITIMYEDNYVVSILTVVQSLDRSEMRTGNIIAAEQMLQMAKVAQPRPRIVDL